MDILKRIRKVRGEIRRTKSIESLEERACNINMRMFHHASAWDVAELGFIITRMDEILTTKDK